MDCFNQHSQLFALVLNICVISRRGVFFTIPCVQTFTPGEGFIHPTPAHVCKVIVCAQPGVLCQLNFVFHSLDFSSQRRTCQRAGTSPVDLSVCHCSPSPERALELTQAGVFASQALMAQVPHSTAHSHLCLPPVLQHLCSLCSWCPRAAPLSPPALTPLSSVPGVPAVSLPCGKPLDLVGWQCPEQHLPLQCAFWGPEPNPSVTPTCLCFSKAA